VLRAVLSTASAERAEQLPQCNAGGEGIIPACGRDPPDGLPLSTQAQQKYKTTISGIRFSQILTVPTI